MLRGDPDNWAPEMQQTHTHTNDSPQKVQQNKVEGSINN